MCAHTALKIQVSGTTADLLHTLGGYVLMCRGPLVVKVRNGSGPMGREQNLHYLGGGLLEGYFITGALFSYIKHTKYSTKQLVYICYY